jgi:hypothetical protein
MRATILALATIILVPARPALAEDDLTEFNVVAGTLSQNLSDHAFDLFSDNDWMAAGSIGLEVEVWDELFVRASYVEGTQMSHLFSFRYDTELTIREPQLTVRKGYSLTPWLRPYAGITGILSYVSARVSKSYEFDLDHAQWVWGGKAGAGVELLIPRTFFNAMDATGLFKDFTLGIALESGYLLRPPVDLSTMGDDAGSSDEPVVAEGLIDMGEIGLAGWYITVDFRAYF